MDLTWGTLLAVIALWCIGAIAYSVATAFVIASAAGRPGWWALLIGGLLPILGPMVWGVVEYAALKRSGYMSRSRGFVVRPVGAAVAWWVAGALFVLALFFPWVRVEGSVNGRFEGDLHLTPLDTTVGAIVIGGTALACLLAGVVVASAMRRRLAILIGGSAVMLLLLCLSSAIIYNSVQATAANLMSWSGHELSGEVRAGTSLWLTAAASLVGVAGAVAAARAADPPVSNVPAVSSTRPAPFDTAPRESTGGW